MDCLRGYISLTACGGGTTPASGLTIDMLEVINKKMLSSIADETQETFKGVLTDIESRAVLRFRDVVRSEFNKKQKLKSILNAYNLRKDVDFSTTYIADGLNTKGVYLSLNELNATQWHDPLMSIYVQSISIYFTDNVGDTVGVKVVDIDSGTTLYSTTVTVALGWNTVDIDKIFTGSFLHNPQRIYIAFDAENITAVSKVLQSTVVEGYGRGLTINGFDATNSFADTLTHDDLNLGSNTYGMSIIASTRCQYDAVVCQNRDLLARAWLYCLGVEVMREVQTSDRLNQYTIVGKQTAIDYEKKFTDDMMMSIFNAVDSISLSNSPCIECNQEVTIKTTNKFH